MIECKISCNCDIDIKASGSIQELVNDVSILAVGVYQSIKEQNPQKAESFQDLLCLNLGYERLWELTIDDNAFNCKKNDPKIGEEMEEIL